MCARLFHEDHKVIKATSKRMADFSNKHFSRAFKPHTSPFLSRAQLLCVCAFAVDQMYSRCFPAWCSLIEQLSTGEQLIFCSRETRGSGWRSNAIPAWGRITQSIPDYGLKTAANSIKCKFSTQVFGTVMHEMFLMSVSVPRKKKVERRSLWRFSRASLWIPMRFSF